MTPLPTVPAPFQLNATVSRLYDGDTFFVDVDWGKRQHTLDQPVRLLGCNAAELHTDGGDAAAANLAALLPVGTPLVLATVKDDKFAPRWDCQVAYLFGPVVHDLTTDLVMAGWAAPWNGVGTKPVPPWPRAMPMPTAVRPLLNRAVSEWRGVVWS